MGFQYFRTKTHLIICERKHTRSNGCLTFAKGKTITHKLSQAELEANAQMKGGGIFSDRYDKFLGKVKDLRS